MGDIDFLFNVKMVKEENIKEYMHDLMHLVQVECYKDATTKIACKRGCPINSNLYKCLHKKKVANIEKSFFEAYSYACLEEGVVVATLRSYHSGKRKIKEIRNKRSNSIK